jgi:hypothetical protein
MLGSRLPIHHGGWHHDLLAREQVERPVEADLLAPWVNTYDRRLALWRPDVAGGGLQIEGCFILGEPDCAGRFLSDI